MSDLPLLDDELELLAELVRLAGAEVIELGCGEARLARTLLQREPQARVTALEVDQRQHAKNLAAPQDRLVFVSAGAEAIPFPDASFDLALMLKSLHHVPPPLQAQALAQVARVLRPGGHLYVSEPVYAGPLNDIVRLFNDEAAVRAAAQTALDRASGSGVWKQVAERRFALSRQFSDVADFERRMVHPTFGDHRIDEQTLAAVRAALGPHMTAGGARFTQPMHVRLLRRAAAV